MGIPNYLTWLLSGSPGKMGGSTVLRTDGTQNGTQIEQTESSGPGGIRRKSAANPSTASLTNRVVYVLDTRPHLAAWSKVIKKVDNACSKSFAING